MKKCFKLVISKNKNPQQACALHVVNNGHKFCPIDNVSDLS